MTPETFSVGPNVFNEPPLWVILTIAAVATCSLYALLRTQRGTSRTERK